jgi:hypothetical protein
LIGDHPLSTLSPESYIFYALFGIPLPSSNQCIVIPNVPVLEWNSPSSSCTNNLILQRPSTQNELPLFEYDIGQVIDILGIDHLIQLWTCLLLERQVLIHSKGKIFVNMQTLKEIQKHCVAFFFLDYSRLMLVAESLTALLFPFSWPHVYVPILPAAMYNFLDAPVPFLMGLITLPADDSRIPSEVRVLEFLSSWT